MKSPSQTPKTSNTRLSTAGETRQTPESKLKEFTTQAPRPLPVIVLADVSGSMGVDGKIQALNLAMKEMLDAFKAEDDLRAEIHVSVITFGGGARVHLPLGRAADASWTDLSANGATPMGAAFDLARAQVEDRSVVPSRA